MTRKPDPSAVPPEPLSLRRWSRRKLDAARTEPEQLPVAPASDSAAVPRETAAQPAPTELPPVDSLTPESDFTAFFQQAGKIDEALKRAALKQLLRDPRFNVMDGLDIYVGDYTQSDPIPDDVLKRLVQARAIFNPPKTMLTPEGHVVDVPPEADAAVPEVVPAPIENAPVEPLAPVAIDPPLAGDPEKTGNKR
jgi:Protein of unknown function (DUF3306)